MTRASQLLESFKLLGIVNEDLQIQKVDDNHIVLFDKAGDETKALKTVSNTEGLCARISQLIHDYCSK